MRDATSDRPAPHVIRLRGPWAYQPLERRGDRTNVAHGGALGPLPAAGMCRLPTTWAELFGAEFPGRARFQRRFGRPTGLETGDRVRLALRDFDGVERVVLNAATLTAAAACRDALEFEIAALLRPRNVLAIDVLCPPEPACCRLGEARLEVLANGPPRC